jgi:hypothetical protein
LRKGIKIKASFMFLAWMLIFSHGIIPHNHHEDISLLHGFHNKGCTVETSNIVIKSHTEDEKGCRISNIIFNKFSQDEQGYTPSNRTSRYFLVQSTTVIYNDHYTFLSGRFTESQSLRAPPCA